MSEKEFMEGFLCPVCMHDLKGQSQLASHFEKEHPEDQDILKSLKDLVGKAKKKILNVDESDLESFKSIIRVRARSLVVYEKQEPGPVTSHTEYFKSVRGTMRLEHFAVETNKLIIRLDRLLNFDNVDRRQHEQSVVQWLDGTSVKLCPSCTKSFNLTRRQHHCRLCGSIMCHPCSYFLPLATARKMTGALGFKKSQAMGEDTSIRLCDHCYRLLESRQTYQERMQTEKEVTKMYQKLQELITKAKPLVVLFNKMCDSLNSGESTYNLPDTQQLRGQIAKQAEQIDLISRQIAALTGTQKELKLHQAVRRGATIYLKENLLSLPQLPTQDIIDSLRKSPPKSINRDSPSNSNEVAILSGWSPIVQPAPGNVPDELDPLIIQMDIIRGYIKEARKALRFEEVALLEHNLRELQKEYHNREQQK